MTHSALTLWLVHSDLQVRVATTMKLTTLAIFILLLTITRTLPVSDHLYFPNEGVEILDVHNFKKSVENSSTAWLVEFYANWCGDCQRFAPIWKKLAADIYQWKDMVKVGALACSDEINTEVCREYEITSYPTVKYFRENYRTGGDLGVDIVHDETVSPSSLKNRIIEVLVEETSEGRGHIYPNLQPYTSSLQDLFVGLGNEVQFVFLLVENDHSYLGVELALDLHRTSPVVVRYLYPSNNTGLLRNLGVKTFPHLVVVDRNNKSQFLGNSDSKHDLKVEIRRFLDTKGIKIVENVDETNSSDSKVEETTNKVLRNHIKNMGDVIFQIDLETALRYSLKMEVSTVKVIKNEQLEALNDYLRVIKDHFPFGNNSLINKLLDLTSQNEVKGSQISSLLHKNNVFSSPEKFLGCLGSSPRYRGYPCSLWRLFHYLTVNFANSNTSVNPKKVLNAIHGYVKHFFSCRHCSEHFQEMVVARNMSGVSSLNESVLWLWEAHNVVNKRLKNDTTEDPEYPKNQFPTLENCPECYGKEGWKKSEVLRYLGRMYGKFNVRYVGSDTTVLFPALE